MITFSRASAGDCAPAIIWKIQTIQQHVHQRGLPRNTQPPASLSLIIQACPSLMFVFSFMLARAGFPKAAVERGGAERAGRDEAGEGRHAEDGHRRRHSRQVRPPSPNFHQIDVEIIA